MSRRYVGTHEVNGTGMDREQELAGGGGAPSPKKRKILIVDDDQLLLGTYASVLRAEDFDVLVASNGEEALGMLREPSLPDIIFTGIVMPKMGGFELVEKLRADPRLSKILVVFSSHRGLAEDKARASALGVSDFIIQGFTTPQEVVRRMRLLLGLNRKFKISISPDRFSAKNLVEILEKLGHTDCVNAPGEEIVLELEATAESDKFKVRIVC